MKNKKKNVLKYTLVGVFLTVFNFGLYTIIARFIINNNDFLWLSTLISSTISALLAYFLHSKITWKERNPGKIGIIKFLIWNLVEAIAINPALTWFFGLFTGLYEFVFNICQSIGLGFDYEFVESTGAFALTAVVTMILNFLFYDKFVFGKKKEEEDKKDEE